MDSEGLPDTPVIGAKLTLRAYVRLGELAPSDVVVQAVLGRVDENENLTDVRTVTMSHAGTDSLGEVFVTDTALPISGAVGYTVRVLPHHELLVGDAELGLVRTPNA